MAVIRQHEHPLTLIDLNPEYPHDEEVYDDERLLISNQRFQCTCDRCHTKITYLHRYYYKCDQCHYSLHKLCSELPTTLKHVSHLAHTLALFQNGARQNCHVCKCTIWEKQLHYCCSPCMLNICLACGTKEAHHNTIYHPSHKHPLIPTSKPILATCNACGEDHKGVFYQCITCFRSLIHEDCAFRPKRLLIQDSTCGKFFHTHELILTYKFPKVEQEAKYYPRCKVCDESFINYANHWIYKCENCRYYTHLDCAYLRSEPSQAGVRRLSNPDNYEHQPDVLQLPFSEQTYTKIKDFFFKETDYERSITHNSHEHPLILVDELKTSMTTNDALCNACLIPIRFNMTFYKCKSSDLGCNFVLHDWCTRLPAELHDYKDHPQHTLLLFPKVAHKVFGFNCNVCRRVCNGFAYSCVKCDYHVDVACAFIPGKIAHKSHPYHLLSVVDELEQPYKASCRMCLYEAWSIEPTLCCKTCEFHLHLECALLLPETIRHKYDKHPMTLSYSPAENHVGDYFCEVCEEELNPNVCFYHCIECDQSIHTACVPLIPQSQTRGHVDSLDYFLKGIKFGGTPKIKHHSHERTKSVMAQIVTAITNGWQRLLFILVGIYK